jgi:hypothetical protein
MIVRVSLFVLAALALAAHFLRDGELILVAACVLVPLLFLVKKRWSLVVLQLTAYAAALLWTVTAWQIALERQALGIAWVRAAAIVGAVALVTLAAGLLLNSRVARERYPV